MTHPEHIHTAIVGCGAAGLMAAIHTHRAATQGRGGKVVAFDGAKKIGAKILVAGGGRCNVTHFEVAAHDYFGSPSRSVERVLKRWPVRDTVAWFKAHGVTLKREDTGKLFPVTDKAHTVLSALLEATRQAGVELRHPCRVIDLQTLDTQDHTKRFQLTTDRGTVTCENLILATGGKALPRSGSDGTGYRFAQAFGHSVSQTRPALVPLITDENHFLRGLSGLSVEAELIVSDTRKKKQYSFPGPVLFTHFGLSGPAAMNVSRHLSQTPGNTLTINLAGQSFEACDQSLAQTGKQSLAANLTNDFGLPQRLAQALCDHLHLSPTQPLSQLRKDDRRRLAHALTALPIPVTGDRGYNYAEVTAGGVPLSEINLATMASKKTPGLYLCGEILDVDGRIGGFNFQWAWCTGKLAGENATRTNNK